MLPLTLSSIYSMCDEQLRTQNAHTYSCNTSGHLPTPSSYRSLLKRTKQSSYRDMHGGTCRKTKTKLYTTIRTHTHTQSHTHHLIEQTRKARTNIAGYALLCMHNYALKFGPKFSRHPLRHPRRQPDPHFHPVRSARPHDLRIFHNQRDCTLAKHFREIFGVYSFSLEINGIYLCVHFNQILNG